MTPLILSIMGVPWPIDVPGGNYSFCGLSRIWKWEWGTAENQSGRDMQERPKEAGCRLGVMAGGAPYARASIGRKSSCRRQQLCTDKTFLSLDLGSSNGEFKEIYVLLSVLWNHHLSRMSIGRAFSMAVRLSGRKFQMSKEQMKMD